MCMTYIPLSGMQVPLFLHYVSNHAYTMTGTGKCFVCAFCSDSLLGLPYIPPSRREGLDYGKKYFH